tara:strand:- start:577 stop:2406 length:1830 start_codon:yes stop_codon:yes gene_type:complete
MGFTPFKAFVKGGAEFAQKVALARLEGEYELRKATGKIRAKALADKAGLQTTFMAGPVKLTFTDTDEGNDFQKVQGDVTDMFNVIQGDKYNAFLNAAKVLPDGKDRVSRLNNFLKGRVASWNEKNYREEKIGDKTTRTAIKDILTQYPEYQTRKNTPFAENVLAPAYGLTFDRLQMKYPQAFGMQIDKTYTPDGFVEQAYLPYMTSDKAQSSDGMNIIKSAMEVAKNRNTKYTEILRNWMVGQGEDKNNFEKQKKVWTFYNRMKNEIGPVDNVKQFSTDRLKTVYQLRNDALEAGIDDRLFADMFSTLIPEFSNINYKPNDPYLYLDTRDRETQRREYFINKLKNVYDIDIAKLTDAKDGALKAQNLANTMLNEIERSQIEAGPARQQPFVASLFSAFEGFFGKTGMFRGLIQGIGNWKNNTTMANKNPAARGRLNTLLEEAQKGLSSEDDEVRRTARINLMKFNLAYAMASALQGGTGGRTISDQDVENMMRSMNFTASSSVDEVKAALGQIRDVMADIAFVKGLYAQGGPQAATAYVLEQADAEFGKAGGNYADFVSRRLEKKIAAKEATLIRVPNPNKGKKHSGYKNGTEADPRDRIYKPYTPPTR